jgi:hypothetical protein
MFLVHWGRFLRMSFSVAFSAEPDKKRGQDENDNPSFFRREDKAMAQGFKPRAPDSFQLSN